MIYLVAPDPVSFTSGGNRFNQQILDGLSFLGYPAKRIEYEEIDDFISGEGGILIYDSLYLDRLQIPELKKIKAKKIFLIHLLPSMLGDVAAITREQNILACF